MADSPERLVAVATLLRTMTARLALQPFDEELTDWGSQLHDRFALPFCLRQDLCAVLGDLERAGLGLAPPLRRALLDDEFRVLGRVAFDSVELTVKRALEFWPLVGDAATQDRGTSRLVDASTARVELCLQPRPGHQDRDFDGWSIATGCGDLPLRRTGDEFGPARLFGLRYRSFVPSMGLHPTLLAQGPIALLLWHPKRRNARRITLYEWRPDNKAYNGLPEDGREARARRLARIVVEDVPAPRPCATPGSAPCVDALVSRYAAAMMRRARSRAGFEEPCRYHEVAGDPLLLASQDDMAIEPMRNRDSWCARSASRSAPIPSIEILILRA